MSFSHITIIGAGFMGQGIARTIAATGNNVTIIDKTQELLAHCLESLGESMDADIRRWGLTDGEKKAILARIQTTDDLWAVDKADLVIECIEEDFNRKNRLFSRIDKLAPPECIFITNTATLSVTELAAATDRADKFLGLHFLSPVHRIPLVELVRGLMTSECTQEKVVDFVKMIGKTPVRVYESPGYITTRVIVPLINEAMYVLMEGIASAADIDTALKLGYGLEKGPLGLADAMGLDNVLAWMGILHRELGGRSFFPCPLLKKMVRAGHLGKKSGQGFFRYDEEGNVVPGSGSAWQEHSIHSNRE